MITKKMKKIIHTDQAPAAVGPYSQAVAANGFLFLSGQIAIDPATQELKVHGTIQEETKQVMNNMLAVLAEAGLGPEQLVKCSIFMKDMNDYAAINEVYASYFEGIAPPAREAVQVSRLPKDVRVEISAFAAYPQEK